MTPDAPRSRPAATVASYLADEVRRIALARALQALPAAALADRLARARAYADAGIAAGSDADDGEALRRAKLHRAWVLPPQMLGVAA